LRALPSGNKVVKIVPPSMGKFRPERSYSPRLSRSVTEFPAMSRHRRVISFPGTKSHTNSDRQSGALDDFDDISDVGRESLTPVCIMNAWNMNRAHEAVSR